jgi:hypothetical protein
MNMKGFLDPTFGTHASIATQAQFLECHDGPERDDLQLTGDTFSLAN